MEKRAILAAVLMAGLLFVYQFLFVKPPPPQSPAPPQPAQEAAPATTGKPEPPAPALTVPAQETSPVPERKVKVETPLYVAGVGSQGGRLDMWDLIYRGLKPMVIPGQMAPLGLPVARGEPAARPVGFVLSPDRLVLTQGVRQGELTLVGEDGFGLRVTETMKFDADSYLVVHDIKVENRHSVPQTAEIGLTWVTPIEFPKG